MSANTGRAAARTAARPTTTTPALPPVTVGRFDEAARLMERLVEEKADVFLAAASKYRQRARVHTERRLDPAEAAQVAAALAETVGADDPVAVAERVQHSDLRAVAEPEPQEMLLAAGAATAPALLEIAKLFTALIEMPADRFEGAREAGTLNDALAEDAKALDRVALTDARARASAALGHFTREAGAGDPGEALGLIGRVAGQAFTVAMQTLGDQMRGRVGDDLSTTSSTPSPEPTGGTAEPSSTGPGTPTP